MSAGPDALARWADDPVSFVVEVFGATPDPWQEEVLRAFPHQKRLALKACKGPGKSTVMAWCGWNFLLTRPHPKVVCTSISGDNLRDGLWTEFAKWQGRSPLLRAAFDWNAERITAKDHPETWWAAARSWSKSADPSSQADTLAGIHADYVLFLVDEAGGIPDGVVAAAEAGLATGVESKLFIAGNPTHLTGPLYRACTREASMWWTRSITGDPDSPSRASRIDKAWARQQIEKYGRDNPWVLVNVFGEFPPGQSNTLLGPNDVERAMSTQLGWNEYNYDSKILGVDVAWQGSDRTVIFKRQGRYAMAPLVFRNLNPMEVAGQVSRVINEWKPDAVFIDNASMGGGVVTRLQQLGFNVIGIDFAQKPLEPRYLNARMEMWANMADWVKAGACLPNEPELISELTSPTYKFTATNKLQLESKDDLRKRGLPSPDLADALALTFAAPVPMKSDVERYAEKWEPQKTITDYDPFADRAY